MKLSTIWLCTAALLAGACKEGAPPAPSPTPTNTPTPTPTHSWQLVWSDEFDGQSIDASKWRHEKNCWGGGNNELQCYTDRPENSFLQDGKLHIVARHESFSGPAHNDDDPNYNPADTSATQPYTSARLRSKNQGDWRYGRIEVAAQMPKGQGLLPAVWMLPTQWRYGGWPLSGEIDIVEVVNPGVGAHANEAHGTLHYGRLWPNNNYSGSHTTVNGNVWEGLHQYAIEWEPDEIRWYVDGKHYGTQRPATETRPGWFTYFWNHEETGFSFGENGAPFDQTFHLLLNLAVGGNWPGAPDANTQFPQTLSVDYVRVYQCTLGDEPTPDGRGCATKVDEAVQPVGTDLPGTETFSLFDNGLTPLPLNHEGYEFQQPLNLYSWSAIDGDVEVAMVTEGDATHWAATYFSAGNSFVNVAESPLAHDDTGVKFVNMADYGELKFDMKILSIDPATRLKVKLDSGWPNVSETTLTLPDHNDWASYAVAFAQMADNSIDPGRANLEQVHNPFVLEATGPADLRINNVRIQCLGPCGIQPRVNDPGSVITETISVFEDAVNGAWELGLLLWETGSPHVQLSAVDAADNTRGQVIDVQFTSSSHNGLAFMQTASPKDLSAFASSGYFSFDIQVLDYAAATGLVIKADCVHPCSSGDIAIGQPGMGGWQTVQVPVADLVAGGLNLSQVNTPFAILPTWGEQAGVHLQLDNIQWVLP
ncbi:family 16 glycosylhydrolase [Simiduia sp. 21SJ11W-1]|uniref:glycoside hydrolase family 16 protein n=1 Tax=Simiduia sp. 21SJ11W-1 TaxID=2909669 RepID=UPI0020A1E9CB|nr:glycoside hydrolase family 16 protein [Simiduia sp. 21SJ11W-1]UTA47173.1 family 16 glycosylhydrolase [Simiduia sp. 21SJ11W-1]